MATYNGAKYLREQIISILTQIGDEDELIISDDGSEDDTLSIIESFGDNRIRLYHNNGKHGVIWNFENAIKKAKGDYIFLVDQDDIWEENKVSRCLEALKNVDLVVHNARVVYEDKNHNEEDFFQIRHSGPGYWKNLYKNSFMGSCMVFRKGVKDYVLPFPPHILWHDMWIGLMAEKKGKTRFINDKLLHYRRHDNNTSATSEKSKFSLWKMLKYRSQMFYYTSIR